MNMNELKAAITEISPDFDFTGLKKADLVTIFEELTDEGSAGRNMASTMAKYRPTYKPGISPSGRKSLNKGDEVAQVLEGREPEEVLAIAETLLGLDPGTLRAKYANLNRGQQRMNGGNRIRSAIKRGDFTVDELKAVAH